MPAAGRLAPPAFLIPRLARGPALEDFLDMRPEGEVAQQMARVRGFVQRNPHDGEPVSEPTEAYLGYDLKNLYVVFVCFDDPAKVRARMSRREDVYDDDTVEVMLDTFHDRRRAYAFQTTPLGVQWDAIWTEAGYQATNGFDTSFDTVWYSRGKLTSQGYVVWIAIPFKSLRFSPQTMQDWGIILYRGIVRKNEDSFWPHISYSMEGRLGQAGTLNGLEGISPGRSMEFIPYGVMRGFRALDTRVPLQPFFSSPTAVGQFGMDSKFILHDNLVLDLTANPDFSQVESEDPQITANQRFAVYFPEKRPFFLENADFFRTPIDLFFTRQIGDPSAGIRLTGKQGPYSIGLLATDDRTPGLAVPDFDRLSGSRAYFTIARISRDIFRQSSVGVLYADWECRATGEFNRIGGVDSRLKFGSNWTVTDQAVASSSNLNGRCEAGQSVVSAGNLANGYQAGPADKLEVQRTGLHFTYDGQYNDISRGFTTIPGFVNRVDIRETRQEVDYRFRPKSGPIISWGPTMFARYTFDHTGLRLDTDYQPQIAVELPRQTHVFFFPYEELRERLRPADFPTLAGNQDYHEHNTAAVVQTTPLRQVALTAFYQWGDGVNFVPPAGPPCPATSPGTTGCVPFLARVDVASATLTLRPLTALKIDNTYLFDRLRSRETGMAIFNNHILRSKWNWQFTRELSLRMILQYNATLANPAYTSLQTTKQFNADFLVTYLLHPGTAIYVGYNSDVQNLARNLAIDPVSGLIARTRNGYLNDSRQFFVKVSYLLRF